MSEEQPKRHFKGVWIPKEIWESTRISWMEKCLLAEINSLDDGAGCFATNAHLAKRFGTSESSIANQISRLRKEGFLRDKGFDGRRRRVCVVHNPRVKKDEGSPVGEGRVHRDGDDSGFTRGLMQGSPVGEGRVHSQVIPYIEIPAEVSEEIPARFEAVERETLRLHPQEEDRGSTAEKKKVPPKKKEHPINGSIQFPRVPIPIEFPARLETPKFRAAWTQYMLYRKERRLSAYTPRSLQAKLLELAAYGPDIATAAIEKTIANNWQGIFPERLNPTPGQSNGQCGAPRGQEAPIIKRTMSSVERDAEEARIRLRNNGMTHPTNGSQRI